MNKHYPIDIIAHGIMFHHFYNEKHPNGQGAINADMIDDIIQFLDPNRILPASDFLDKSISGKLEKHHLCLTFDDALLCQYDIALPVLEKYNLTAFWFVYSSVFLGHIERLEVYRYFRTTNFNSIDHFYEEFFETIDRSEYKDTVNHCLLQFKPDHYLKEYPFYTILDKKFRYIRDDVLGQTNYFSIMDELIKKYSINIDDLASLLWLDDTQLKTLANKSHIIGLHSFSHPTRLSELNKEEQHSEYLKNLHHLQSILNNSPVTMSHPCNSYNQDTLEILRSMGIRLGFRANMASLQGSNLEVPRQDHATIVQQLKGH